MGINIKNNIRLVNAKLGAVDITTLGKTFAIQYGLDGMSVVDVTVQAPPTDIKEFLEGNTLRTQYAVASDVDNLVDYVFRAFPNLEEIYLFNTDGVTLGSNAFTGLSELEKIYVPEDLLNDYKTNYPQLASLFTGIVQDYVLTIPHIEGTSTTLTSEYVDSIIAMLSVGQKSSITKLVIDSAFTQESAYEVAWGYNWVNALPVCNDNIWYGSTRYGFTEYTIMGSGELTSEIVSARIASISSGKVSGINKVIVPASFTGYQQNCLDPIKDNNSIGKITLQIENFYIDDYNGTPIISNHISADCKIEHLIYNKTGTLRIVLQDYTSIKSIVCNNATTIRCRANMLTSIEEIRCPLATTWNGYINQSRSNLKIYLDSIQSMTSDTGWIIANTSNIEWHIGTNNCVLQCSLNLNGSPSSIYIPNGSLSYYQNATNWSTWTAKFVED